VSLRINLYGWDFQRFRNLLGSGNSDALRVATDIFVESQKLESNVALGKAWLQTLIEKGFPLNQERDPPRVLSDGRLVTVQMETEVHAFVVYSIIRSINPDQYLDLSDESSIWKHQGVSALYNELAECGFHRTRDCPIELHTWMGKLIHGSPLFGDDFQTEWAFYTFFGNHDLAGIISGFRKAIAFERSIPEDYPDHLRNEIKTRLSEPSRKFAEKLCEWFDRVRLTGQDLFIFWW
jgi:hypothetical protein